MHKMWNLLDRLIMKSLIEFRKTRERMLTKDYCEKYGVPDDDIPSYAVYNYNGLYIEITEKGYDVLIDRTVFYCDRLTQAEVFLWDKFYKHELGMSKDEMLYDLHQRANLMAAILGHHGVSLDEIPQENLTPDETDDINHLLKEFGEVTNMEWEPEPRKYNSDQLVDVIYDVISTSYEMARFTPPYDHEPTKVKNFIKNKLRSLGYD